MIPVLAASDRTSRRELLRIGGLSLLGLSSAQLDRLQAESTSPPRAKSCIFLFLFGGPSQIDLWDMKPQAPPEIRGEFNPIATNVPGIQICEHLPLLAQQMDKLCLLRSMTHRMNVHGPACSEIFTGREYFGPPTTDQATREDWPSLSASSCATAPAAAACRRRSCCRGTCSSPARPNGSPARPAGGWANATTPCSSGRLWPVRLSNSRACKLADDVPRERMQQRRDLLERHRLRRRAAGTTSARP